MVIVSAVVQCHRGGEWGLQWSKRLGSHLTVLAVHYGGKRVMKERETFLGHSARSRMAPSALVTVCCYLREG